jgi:hypothetical protein
MLDKGNVQSYKLHDKDRRLASDDLLLAVCVGTH